VNVSKEMRVPIISQVAYVVHDLDERMRAYHRFYGWGPWRVFTYEPPNLRNLTVRGVPAEFTWLGAETMIGSLNFELLQPVGDKGVFAEWLAANGDGVHHVAYCASTLEKATSLHSELEVAGGHELVSAWMNGVFFYYMETPAGIVEVWTGDESSIRPARRYP
jgi:methylmalonyl-CoA/ethylmalonyl-CoA epimerase